MDFRWFASRQGALVERAAAALKETAVQNRSRLPPFRLPGVAKSIVAGLVAFAQAPAPSAAAGAEKLGADLGRDGLALSSLHAVTRSLAQAIQADGGGEAALLIMVEFTGLLTRAIADADIQELRGQREDMRLALVDALRGREEEMRRLIVELSTPIMPIHDGILVLPVIGRVDPDRARRITERLLETVTERRASVVIIDITGVPSLDRPEALGLCHMVDAVRLIGSSAILVGIGPAIARILTELDVDMTGLRTLATLQSGVEEALARRGLAIGDRSRLRGRRRRRKLLSQAPAVTAEENDE